MIKRYYFISAIAVDTNGVTVSSYHCLFYTRSWFSKNLRKLIDEKLKEFADSFEKIRFDRILITAFNMI